MLPPHDDRPAVPSVTRVRLGLATNSSSSHSLVMLLDPEPEDEMERGRYQWEPFVLVTREAKRHYLAAMLVENAGGLYDLSAQDRRVLRAWSERGEDALSPDDRAHLHELAPRWTRVERHILDLCGLPGGTDLRGYEVNYNSVHSFQRARGGSGPDPEEFARYRDLMLDEAVAVFGGHDGVHERLDEDRQVHLGSTDRSDEPWLRGDG